MEDRIISQVRKFKWRQRILAALLVSFALLASISGIVVSVRLRSLNEAPDIEQSALVALLAKGLYLATVSITLLGISIIALLFYLMLNRSATMRQIAKSLAEVSRQIEAKEKLPKKDS